VAGALFVAGATAEAAVAAVGLHQGDTVAVSGAAGGVGSIAVQLARLAGAQVIGIAGPDHHQWLRDRGVVPVGYGDGLRERILEAAGRIDAFIDTYGDDYVELGLGLGVEPARINTIVRIDAPARYGVKAEGNAAAAKASVLADLAQLIDEGLVEVPIAATYSLDEVQAAYRRLETGHVLGKIVLVP
jgi:NADPH:quinone reductase-like Zn-dependent oxidoreductase